MLFPRQRKTHITDTLYVMNASTAAAADSIWCDLRAIAVHLVRVNYTGYLHGTVYSQAVRSTKFIQLVNTRHSERVSARASACDSNIAQRLRRVYL